MKDLRDPTLLGKALLRGRRGKTTLSEAYDARTVTMHRVPQYDHNPGPLEKYPRARNLS